MILAFEKFLQFLKLKNFTPQIGKLMSELSYE